MNISEVSKRTGLPASTLRYYEEKGLIRSVGRQGLRRVFKSSVLQQLALISLGRAAGLSLAEITQMLGTDGQLQINRQLLIDKAEEINRTILKLTAMRDGLQHAAVCSAPSHMECPKFRRLLQLASVGVFERDKKKTIRKAVS